jgi:hypothetical protein
MAKIKLIGVNNDTPLNQRTINYFQELIDESAVLMCKFDGHPFEDGVELRTLQHENVNLIMNKLITPSWEQKDTEGKFNLRN